MNRKRSLLIILLLVSSALPLLITVPIAKASEITIPISHNYDDVWMTEAGNIFSNTEMVLVLDDEIGLHSFLRFQNIPLSKASKINVATLYVWAGHAQVTPDPGSSVTIYGIDEPDCAPFTSDGTLWSLSRPYTTASVNWNMSAWPQGWRTVNVTSIVKEIINQYAWTPNNSLGLQILGPSDSGQESRDFEDYAHPHHDAPAKLYIQYDVAPGTPPGVPGDAILLETYGDYDIWTSLEFENFYEDWTELDPLNLIATSEVNPYRITFWDFGMEEFWDDLTYFSRDDLLNNTADYIEVRFKATLTDEEVPYYRPDFNWVQLSGGGYTVNLQHYVGGAGGDEDHFFALGADAVTWGEDTAVFIDPIPPTRQGWFAFLWDYDLKQITVRQYSTEPNSSTAWYTDFTFEDNATGADIDLVHWTLVRFTSRTKATLGDGLNWGYLENMIILVDFAPALNGTIYYVVDSNGTIIWSDVAPDIGWVEDYIDDYVDPGGGDPLDPDPGTQGWDTEGPWTRFKMRLYILFIGLGCVFVPLWGMAYKKFDAVGYAWCFLIMVLGVGLLWSITGI